jgi:hypothetical protein
MRGPMFTSAQWIEVIKALGPTLATLGSALWIAFTYFAHQKEARALQLEQAQKENQTRMLEARKPFVQRQLELYTETSQVAGRVVTLFKIGNQEWESSVKRFYQLFWTELSVVEDQQVKEAMEGFAEHLRDTVDAYKQSEYEGGKKLETSKNRVFRSG